MFTVSEKNSNYDSNHFVESCLSETKYDKCVTPTCGTSAGAFKFNFESFCSSGNCHAEGFDTEYSFGSDKFQEQYKEWKNEQKTGDDSYSGHSREGGNPKNPPTNVPTPSPVVLSFFENAENRYGEPLFQYGKDFKSTLLDFTISIPHYVGFGIGASERYVFDIVTDVAYETYNNIATISEYGWNELKTSHPSSAHEMEMKCYEAADVVLDAKKNIRLGTRDLMDDFVYSFPDAANSYVNTVDEGIRLINIAGDVIGEWSKTMTPHEIKSAEYSVPFAAGKLFKFGGKLWDKVDFISEKIDLRYTSSGVKIVKDVRLDGYTSEAAHKLLENVHFKEVKTAEIMNRQISQWYDKPPFIGGGKVGILEFNGQGDFVHVYSNKIKTTSIKGQFLMLESELKGLSPAQIRDKFDLPYTPTHYARADLPNGLDLAVGTVRPSNFGGIGKGTQFYIIKEAEESWFKNYKKLPEEIK